MLVAAAILAAFQYLRRVPAATGGIGAPAPDPELTGIVDGNPHRLSERRGQPILLFVFDTTGPRSWQAMEIVERLHRRFYRRGLATIGVVTDTDVEGARRYVRANPFTFLVLADPGGKAFASITGGRPDPVLFLVDRQGTLSARLPEPQPTAVGALRERLDRELPVHEGGW